MLDTRMAVLEATTPDVIVSSDVSCLMQIHGRVTKEAKPGAPRIMHLAQVLASR